MTHQHHTTNGASLEDCHTNFFALTELCGIKWRKLTWGGGGNFTNPLDDPVLSSYSRCLAGDVLCVWRRVARPNHHDNESAANDHLQPPPPPPPVQPPPLSLAAAKELWIFWYGEEPDVSGLISQELTSSDQDHGSWESGLSYECRSLLFKALHNLIERCLLSRDFVRLGKWFVQPVEIDEELAKSELHLSFSFAFFVHGENTVCASVDVRQHPVVRKFTKSPSEVAHNTKVILAPFGLAGTVISSNNNNATSEPNSAQVAELWNHFYPMDDDSTVDVNIGGSRMRYPSKYVLLTDMDEVPFTLTSDRIYEQLSATVLAHRSLTELCLAQQESELNGGADASIDIKPGKRWDFVDPTRKSNCSCSKCRRGSKRNSAGERVSRRPPPFHRRRAPRYSSTCLSIGGSQGTPGGGSPGSCGGGSPIGSGDVGAGGVPPSPTLAPPLSVTNPVGTPNMTAPVTPRAISSVPPATPSQILLPHTPAPTPPALAPPHTPLTPRTNHGQDGSTECLKRPVFSLQETEFDPSEEERPLDLLYDYSTLNAWLNHPVKKFKSDDHNPMETDISTSWDDLSQRKGDDLYAGHTHTKMAPVDPQSCNGPLSYIKTEIKQEPNQDDAKENKNLFTSDGLQASYRDLEQIFDNSDDTSGDETVRLLQVHTPPDSNKSGGGCLSEDSGMMGGTTLNNGGRTISRAPCAVRPEELSKMFPTPPSLEPNPLPSPGAYNQSDMDHQVVPNIRCGSPPEELIEDWTFVFKPPTICKYVGSSKYAALPGIVSSPAPGNCVYRPSWQQQTATTDTRVVPRPPAPRTPHHMPNLHSVGTISQPASVGCVSGVGSAPPPPLAATPSPASSAPPTGPTSALLLNLLLADTSLNIFRDHNFDSCTMCVCNAEPHHVVGNIRGADSGVYLTGGVPSPASPDSPSSPMQNQMNGIGSGLTEEDSIRCSCGFSAVVNRRLAHRAGLFYEDEMEITGLAEDPAVYKKSGGVFCEPDKSFASNLIELIREHCSVFNSSASALHLAASEEADKGATEPQLHLLEYADSGEVAAMAMEAVAGRAAHIIHKWPYLRAPAPSCGRDVVKVMRKLQPLLQDAIQKKCSTRMWDAVAGPLTWRQFHRLAGRGTDDLCEPQPVPPLLFGHDRDWVSLSPYAVHYWDKLLLEPYSYTRDIGYVVLVPDSSALIPKVRSFFRDLSTAYEQCRLGRHVPINRISKDGIFKVPRPQCIDGPDDWFASLSEGTTTEILKAYAHTCRSSLAQTLSSVQLDKTLFDNEYNSNNSLRLSMPERSAPSPMAPPSIPDHPATPTPQNEQEMDNSNNLNSSTTLPNTNSVPETSTNNDDDEGNAPCIVVYLVEPPTGGDKRTSCLAMLRSASALLNSLPESLKPHVFTQLISSESISDIGIGNNSTNGRIKKRSAQLKSLALNIFSQCRRQLSHTTNIKSLTGFGTAANADQFLKNKDEKNRLPYRLYTPPYVLAPPRPLKDIAETFGQAASEPCSVLYLSYCLSADQSWLLAVATDGRGEIQESININVDVPGRSRRRRAPPARRLGLTKLMDFILGIMSQSVQPWRLVVGRIGRIGHGELKGWSWLLSRKNLLKASTQLREVCTSCSLMYPGSAPCILSACLVSTEPDASLRLMADQFTPDERFSQVAVASQLSTPQDVSCTHILVFPTSATTQSSQSAFQDIIHINDPELGDDMDLFPVLNDDMPDENEFNDIFNGWSSGMQSPGASPKREDDGTSRPGSPGRPAASHGRHSPLSDDGNGRCGEKVGTLLQQPLALGYLVSTAPIGRMPNWWWAACPHAVQACPAFLKNALHLHSPAVQQNSDDLLQPQAPTSLPQHPLDSQYTTDVLRYVLEGYNALSWLSLDCNTQDRSSCLPAHVQVLMQLYHLTAALI